jgi:hypothetical protein
MESGEELVGAKLGGFAENHDGYARCGDEEEEVVHDELEQGFELVHVEMGRQADHAAVAPVWICPCVLSVEC